MCVDLAASDALCAAPLAFRVWGFRVGVQGLGFQGSGFRVSGFRVPGLEFQGSGLQGWGLGFRFQTPPCFSLEWFLMVEVPLRTVGRWGRNPWCYVTKIATHKALKWIA